MFEAPRGVKRFETLPYRFARQLGGRGFQGPEGPEFILLW